MSKKNNDKISGLKEQITSLKEAVKLTHPTAIKLLSGDVRNIEKVLRDHLNSHIKVAREQLTEKDKMTIFKEFDNAIVNQLKKLGGDSKIKVTMGTGNPKRDFELLGIKINDGSKSADSGGILGGAKKKRNIDLKADEEPSSNYPKDCYECENFGEIDGVTHFPSLCKKNLLWFDCGGKEGIKKEPAPSYGKEDMEKHLKEWQTVISEEKKPKEPPSICDDCKFQNNDKLCNGIENCLPERDFEPKEPHICTLKEQEKCHSYNSILCLSPTITTCMYGKTKLEERGFGGIN